MCFLLSHFLTEFPQDQCTEEQYSFHMDLTAGVLTAEPVLSSATEVLLQQKTSVTEWREGNLLVGNYSWKQWSQASHRKKQNPLKIYESVKASYITNHNKKRVFF